jgi:hypothetical protein
MNMIRHSKYQLIYLSTRYTTGTLAIGSIHILVIYGWHLTIFGVHGSAVG